jgi:hypothetical protein
MAETTRRPGAILGEMICVATIDDKGAILEILPEHATAVRNIQDWTQRIESVGLQEHFGTEEGFWEVMERLGYYADKEDYQDRDNMDVELWTDTASQAERIAGLNAFCAELHAKALALTARLTVLIN